MIAELHLPYGPAAANAYALPLTAAVALLAALALWTIAAFNRLVRERNLVQEGWSGIDVQLKRRRNLVPNLVETVRGYARYERELLEEVARLRAGADDLKQTEDRENAVSDRLRTLLALAEDYPDLRANRNFLRLQEQLCEIEDQIQMARRYYNGAVRNYNIRVESFPSRLVAGMLRFRRAEFFQIETATERAAVKVEV